MFSFFQKKSSKSETGHATLNLKISGMHCHSCAMNIDGALEDTPGVISANTNFARGVVVVQYDNSHVSPDALKTIIQSLGYEATE